MTHISHKSLFPNTPGYSVRGSYSTNKYVSKTSRWHRKGT